MHFSEPIWMGSISAYVERLFVIHQKRSENGILGLLIKFGLEFSDTHSIPAKSGKTGADVNKECQLLVLLQPT